MRRRYGEVGTAFAVIGIVMMLVGFVLNYFPVPEQEIVRYADVDKDGIPETPVYETRWVFPFAVIGLGIFTAGFVLFVTGGISIIIGKDDVKPPKPSDHVGQDYRERMPPPDLWRFG